MAQVVMHLWELGHRKVWYVFGARDRAAILASELGFRRVFERKETPLSDDQILHMEMTGRGARTVIERYLKTPSRQRPTAIACANDLAALGVLRAAEESGLSVPGDFSLTGCDGSPQAKWVHPRLSIINQPLRLLGQRAAEILVAGSDGVRRAHHASFPGELEVGGSTARVGSAS